MQVVLLPCALGISGILIGMSHNFLEFKRQFLEYVEIEKGRSLSTVLNYDHYLSRFLEFSKITTVEEITDTMLREYRLWLNRQESKKGRTSRGETLKRRTQNYYLAENRKRFLGDIMNILLLAGLS